MAQKLTDEGLYADVLLASSARRVQDTVKRLQEHWSPDAELLTEPSLYLASPQLIATHIQALHDSWSNAMLIGPQSGDQRFGLPFGGRRGYLELPTAAVAVFTCDVESWTNSITGGTWNHFALWKPRELETS